MCCIDGFLKAVWIPLLSSPYIFKHWLISIVGGIEVKGKLNVIMNPLIAVFYSLVLSRNVYLQPTQGLNKGDNDRIDECTLSMQQLQKEVLLLKESITKNDENILLLQEGIIDNKERINGIEKTCKLFLVLKSKSDADAICTSQSRSLVSVAKVSEWQHIVNSIHSLCPSIHGFWTFGKTPMSKLILNCGIKMSLQEMAIVSLFSSAMTLSLMMSHAKTNFALFVNCDGQYISF